MHIGVYADYSNKLEPFARLVIINDYLALGDGKSVKFWHVDDAKRTEVLDVDLPLPYWSESCRSP